VTDPDYVEEPSYTRDIDLLQSLRESVAAAQAARGMRVEDTGSENRLIFVGYPYRLPKDDYRGVFAEVAEEYGVTFIFADEELTNKHILEKISTMMAGAAFSLFDITYWNPNVALELGIAYGRGLDYYILFDPTKEERDVLSDLRGIDRIQYTSYTQLKEELAKLMRNQFGAPEQEQQAPEAGSLVGQMDALRERVPELLRQEPGLQIGGIASSLGIPIDIAQPIVRPLVGPTLETRGVRRGTRYYLVGEAPPEEPEGSEEPEPGEREPRTDGGLSRRP
jgi:hypothetical protein